MEARKTAKLQKRLVEAYLHRGHLYASMAQYEQAMRDEGEAIRLDPENADAFNARCWDQAIFGELDPAKDDCKRSLNIKKQAKTFDSMGMVYLKDGAFAWAEDNYTLALNYEPKDASSLFGRGLAFQMEGDFQAAERDKDEALSINPAIAKDYKRYGIAVSDPLSTICQFTNGWHDIAPHSSFVGIACRDKEGRKGKVVVSGSQNGPELTWIEAQTVNPYKELGVSKDSFSGTNSWKAASCEFADAGSELDVECAMMEVAKNETVVDAFNREFQRLNAVYLQCPQNKNDGIIDYSSHNDLGYRGRVRASYNDGRLVYLNAEAFQPNSTVSAVGFRGKAEDFLGEDDRPVVKRYINLITALKDKICFGSTRARKIYFGRLATNRVRMNLPTR